MARPKRIHLKQVLYLITLRVVEGRPLFKDANDIRCYLGLLEEYTARYDVELYAYLLKVDSILLCVEPKTEAGTISEFMHALSSRYTKLYNSRHGVQGHLFRARFRSTIAEKRTHLLPLTAYIHAKAMLFRETPDAVMASSRPAYAAARPECPLTHEALATVQTLLAEDCGVGGYQGYLESLTQDVLADIEASLKAPVVGSEAFVERVKALLDGKASKSDAPAEPKVQIIKAPQAADVPPQQAPARRFGAVPRVFAGAGVAALIAAVVFQAGLPKEALRFSAHEAPQDVRHADLGQETASIAQVHSVPHAEQHYADLNGSIWEIKLVPRRDSMEKAERFDRIVFQGSTMRSGVFEDKGFKQARYAQQSGADALHWEGMQAGASGDVVYWEGVVKGQLLKGTVKVDGPQTKDRFDFVGVMVQAPEPRRVEL